MVLSPLPVDAMRAPSGENVMDDTGLGAPSKVRSSLPLAASQSRMVFSPFPVDAIRALSGENAVVEWASGSSLRPYLDRLPDEQKRAFRQAYAAATRPHYPRRGDGTTILPFHRLFMVARKG